MSMGEWSFLVPPDITVTLRARSKPALLARCLGDETAHQPNATLLLDLAAGNDAGSIARGRYKTIPWSCRVSPRPDGRQTLAWHSPLLREYLALHVALLPALRRLLLERSVALVVGAAFESGGAATVLSGDTGSGKTSALLSVLARGARLIGDEYIGIATTGEVTPALRVLALRRATLAGAPELSRNLTARRRLALRVAALAARCSGGRLDPLVHVSPADLGVSLAPERGARAARLFWLERAAGGASRREPMDTGEALKALARVQEAHDHAYGGLATLLMPSGGDAARWRETLARGLHDVQCVRVAVPPGPLAPDVLHDLLSPALPEALARPSA
jgi:hypothetical protein